MKELWKDIKDYENYQISNYGNIKNKKTDRMLKKTKNKYGYEICCLRNNKKSSVKTIHRLVAEAFIPNPDNLPQINHKDENKQNNNINNLEWCTNQYNSNYGTRGKRIANKLAIVLKKKIVQKKDNNIIKIWDSAKEVEKELNIKRCNICNCCKGLRKTAGGYNWEYAKDSY